MNLPPLKSFFLFNQHHGDLALFSIVKVYQESDSEKLWNNDFFVCPVKIDLCFQVQSFYFVQPQSTHVPVRALQSVHMRHPLSRRLGPALVAIFDLQVCHQVRVVWRVLFTYLLTVWLNADYKPRVWPPLVGTPWHHRCAWFQPEELSLKWLGFQLAVKSRDPTATIRSRDSLSLGQRQRCMHVFELLVWKSEW